MPISVSFHREKTTALSPTTNFFEILEKLGNGDLKFFGDDGVNQTGILKDIPIGIVSLDIANFFVSAGLLEYENGTKHLKIDDIGIEFEIIVKNGNYKIYRVKSGPDSITLNCNFSKADILEAMKIVVNRIIECKLTWHERSILAIHPLLREALKEE